MAQLKVGGIRRGRSNDGVSADRWGWAGVCLATVRSVAIYSLLSEVANF